MNWTGRIIVLSLLAVIIGVPVLMKAPRAADGNRDPDNPNRLVIISPHNEQIRFEIGNSFNRWRATQGKPVVTFDWRSGGGTSDLRKQVINEYEAEAKRALREGREMKGIGYDLFFGGGEYEHNKFAMPITVTERIKREGETKEESIKFHIGVPIEMPDGMLEDIFPTPTIASAALYNPERRWMGVVLASFGIVYNRDVLHSLDLPSPTTWTDLTDPRYRGMIALADPAHSGSITEAYNAILQRIGWNEGWRVLRRIYANAKSFAAVSTQVSMEVSSGDSAAGMTIDFYGRFQSGVIGPAASVQGPRLGYVDPVGMTKVNADPITILLGAPHGELANEFVLWLLSKDGQRIWQRKLGAEDGPVKFELRRQPVRRDLYTPEEMQHWTDPENPFELSKPFAPGMPDMYSTIAIVAHAAAIDVHEELVEAWKAIQACKDEAKRAKLIAMFDRMPPELTLEGLPDNWLSILEDANHAEHGAITRKLNIFVNEVQRPWGDIRIKWPKDTSEQWDKIVSDKTDPNHDAVVAALSGFFDAPGWADDLESSLSGDAIRSTWRVAVKDRSHAQYHQVMSAMKAFVKGWRKGDNQLRDRLRWTAYFSENYRAIVRTAEEE